MGDDRKTELRKRRTELSGSLPGLTQKRDHTYRLSSDALALDRAGVKPHAAEDLARLGADQAGADAAIRAAQREIRDLDAEIHRGSGGGLGARMARIVRRPRSTSQ